MFVKTTSSFFNTLFFYRYSASQNTLGFDIVNGQVQWHSNNDLIQRIRPQGQGRGFRIDELGEQVRLDSQFCIVACFRIQILSAEQFKTRLGTKGESLANTKQDFVQHLVQTRG